MMEDLLVIFSSLRRDKDGHVFQMAKTGDAVWGGSFPRIHRVYVPSGSRNIESKILRCLLRRFEKREALVSAYEMNQPSLFFGLKTK
jgi:hypothetical protein